MEMKAGRDLGKIFDHMAIRIKDIIIVGGAIVWLVGYIALPKTVAAQSEDIRQLKEFKEETRLSIQAMQKDIQVVQASQSHMEHQQDEIQSDIKQLLKMRGDRTNG